jgi:FtsP/CotA-like multicopper oxidase with cupredoxin domain
MDGVPGVTQDPVGPGENFIYRLKLEAAGTFWYHPHFNSSEQLERGLKGVFIVEEAEKQPWSRDLIWLMDDWLLQKDGKKTIEQFTRDMVLLGPRESVTIGFVPEHPGIWLTHCHIQEHAEAGMEHAEAGMMTTIEIKN